MEPVAVSESQNHMLDEIADVIRDNSKFLLTTHE